MRYSRSFNSIDVIFSGSSKVYCDIATGVLWEKYGIAAFDLGGAEAPSWGSYYQLKEALKTQDEIDRHQMDEASSAYMHFRLYAAQGKAKKALQALDKYLDTDPMNLRFLVMKMELLEHTNAKKATLYAIYDKILALEPMYLGVLNNYAYHLATHKGDLQKAEQMSAITIREEPTNPVYLDTYGWILYQQGQNELALFYLNRALSNSQEDATRAEIEWHIERVRSKDKR